MLKRVNETVDSAMDGIVTGLATRLMKWLESDELMSKIMENLSDSDVEKLAFHANAEDICRSISNNE